MTTRREFLAMTAAVTLGHAIGARETRARAPLRILILGGTGFVGPHLIHEALVRGHRVAMLNRGQRQPTEYREDFAKVEAIRGARSRRRTMA